MWRKDFCFLTRTPTRARRTHWMWEIFLSQDSVSAWDPLKINQQKHISLQTAQLCFSSAPHVGQKLQNKIKKKKSVDCGSAWRQPPTSLRDSPCKSFPFWNHASVNTGARVHMPVCTLPVPGTASTISQTQHKHTDAHTHTNSIVATSNPPPLPWILKVNGNLSDGNVPRFMRVHVGVRRCRTVSSSRINSTDNKKPSVLHDSYALLRRERRGGERLRKGR